MSLVSIPKQRIKARSAIPILAMPARDADERA